MTVSVRPQLALSFRARSLLAFVLAPRAPLEDWLADLDLWLARSPGFFSNKPIMLDLSGLEIERAAYETLITDLATRDVRVMAVDGAGPACLDVGLPPLVTAGRTANAAIRLVDEQQPDARRSKPQPKRHSLIIDAPVRSGQSIVHPDGDVTVLKSVASGAEIVAGGSIHIYGTLRGRAVAGMDGLPGARIFCSRLEAELLAIGGAYKTADDMAPDTLGQAAQALLVGEEMKILSLG